MDGTPREHRAVIVGGAALPRDRADRRRDAPGRPLRRVVATAAPRTPTRLARAGAPAAR
jgi:hypothetical protein